MIEERRADHTVWTVDTTSYQQDRNVECIAIHYQSPPKRDEDARTTSFGLRFPTLIVTDYLDDKRAVAERIATILNRHWDDN